MTKLESTGPPAIAAPAMPAPASARVAAPAIMASRRLICTFPPVGVVRGCLERCRRRPRRPPVSCRARPLRRPSPCRTAHAAPGPVARAHVYQAQHAANRAARRDHQRLGCFARRAPRRGSGATGARHQGRVRRCRDRPARAGLWPASEGPPRQLDPCLAWPGHGPRRRLESGRSLHFLLRRRGVPEVPWAYAARQARRAGSGVLRECRFLF